MGVYGQVLASRSAPDGPTRFPGSTGSGNPVPGSGSTFWHVVSQIKCLGKPVSNSQKFRDFRNRLIRKIKYVIGAHLLELWAYKRGDARRKDSDLCFAHSLELC